jgi:hypothetical protein
VSLSKGRLKTTILQAAQNHPLRNIILGVVAVTSGCGGLSNKEKNTYYQKAIPIGQEYFKEIL